ncbi:MAG: GspE/PulE family protein [bacterium]|nr:GspE/PulE family protein [bacterium]MDZ4296638.1 GspE/PulE family protein [Patescibacteria group bacterium]
MQQLKAFLLDGGIIPPAKLEDVEKRSGGSSKEFAKILVGEKFLTEEELAKLEAYILGIPYVNLADETVPKELLEIIPEPIARKHNIVAFRKEGNNLEVAMLDPDDLQTIDFIRRKAKLKILPRMTTAESIRHVLEQYQKTLKAEFGELIQKEAGGITLSKEGGDALAEGEDLARMAEDLPIVRIVETLLKHAVLEKASDIHIEPLEKEVVVRYRIDGALHDAMTLPKEVHQGIVARIKVLANLKLDEHRLPQDGRFKIESDSERVSLRVSILPVFDGEKIVMRLLPENSNALSLEVLGLWGSDLEVMHRAIKRPEGMILVTGPTGSGKTTTLYTVIDLLNTPDVNISTIEDPIEYRMPRVNQTQVRANIGLTFASGLRTLVRQDPDIIMVGEIRDEETASLAINAALTGHLVLSTLHTNSAAGALPRLIDMKVESFLIASTANIILAQRLVRKLCAQREQYSLSKKEWAELGREVNLERLAELFKREKILEGSDVSKMKFYRPKPSTDCPEGYKGRIGIYEILEVSGTIKALINQRATSEEIHERARQEGMTTMLEDGFLKAARGVTSIEEVLRATRE